MAEKRSLDKEFVMISEKAQLLPVRVYSNTQVL
jgi:hypothetical protein